MIAFAAPRSAVYSPAVLAPSPSPADVVPPSLHSHCHGDLTFVEVDRNRAYQVYSTPGRVLVYRMEREGFGGPFAEWHVRDLTGRLVDHDVMRNDLMDRMMRSHRTAPTVSA